MSIEIRLTGETKLDPDIEKRFTYHRPAVGQPQMYERLRETAKGFAYLLMELCPNGRERALALTHLEQTVMWGNAAIAREAPPAAVNQMPPEQRKDGPQPSATVTARSVIAPEVMAKMPNPAFTPAGVDPEKLAKAISENG